MAYSIASLDELGEGYGFRKIRKPLGVTAFGVNALVFPPGYEGPNHYHDTQDELYFVHRGIATFSFDGEAHDVPEDITAEATSQYGALVMSAGNALTGHARFSFTARAGAPMRVSVQARRPSGARWQRSIYVDTTARDITVPFNDMKPVDSGASPHFSPGDIDTVLFVVEEPRLRPEDREAVDAQSHVHGDACPRSGEREPGNVVDVLRLRAGPVEVDAYVQPERARRERGRQRDRPLRAGGALRREADEERAQEREEDEEGEERH
jgi:hypothetical protein